MRRARHRMRRHRGRHLATRASRARKMDARDDEIARLRAALRRATEAAMAYADTSSKRIDELKTQMRRRAETDATTIEELRDALEKARARNDEDDDEPRAAAPSGETTSDDAERALNRRVSAAKRLNRRSTRFAARAWPSPKRPSARLDGTNSWRIFCAARERTSAARGRRSPVARAFALTSECVSLTYLVV